MDRAGRGSSAPVWRVAVVAALLVADARARGQPPVVLDPIQQAVIDSLDASLEAPGGETPSALVEAAIKAADVDALAACERYLARLAGLAEAAGDEAATLLADAADGAGEAALLRLADAIRTRQPAAGELVRGMIEAGRSRRRSPDSLRRAAADLGSPDDPTRRAAVTQLARAGIAALPMIVPLLDPTAEPKPRAQARGLVALLGEQARQPLLDWLGNGDPAQWAAVIEAIRAADPPDVEAYLLAPALVAGTPPAARDAARRLLADRAAGRGRRAVPSPTTAAGELGARLDRLLTPAGLPPVDHLLLEPIATPAEAAAAFGGTVTGSVERWFWNPAAGTLARVSVAPRVARAREAMHLVRDLRALAVADAAAIELVLLARLETLLVTGGDPLTVLERVPPPALREALTGPEGFAVETVGTVFEQAVLRGMWQAAAAAAAAVVPEGDAAAGIAGTAGTLPPATRQALVRALAVPDSALQFAAARALVLAAGEPPYAGSSRVVETLLHAATSTGSDRVIVAHPEVEVAHELAAGLSRFGYEPVRVSTGRQAIFAARDSADTVLVLLSARLAKPTALETTQLIQNQAIGDCPAVLVVVDPLDDDGRGKYLARLILSFCGLERVAIIDRLDSLFEPGADPGSAGPRFPDLLAQVAGPVAVDPASRNTAATVRLARAREALALLGRLGRDGQDVSATLATAELALQREELYAAAASLLAAIGRPGAQLALERETARADLPDAARLVAKSAFEASLEQWGILLETRQMLAAYGRYNRPTDDPARRAAGDVLDVIEAAGRKAVNSPADAPPLRPRR